jgi:uncharacterized protein (UPF0335 family)
MILSLQRLEAQLATVQDKIKREEEEGEKLLQKYKKHSTSGGSKGFDGKCQVLLACHPRSQLTTIFRSQ